MKKNGLKLVCALGLLASGVRATENGGSAYANGAEDLMAGAAPPPGHYLLGYGLHYKADDFIGDNGKALPIPFEAEVNGLILRYLHVSKVEVLGGNWAQHIFVPVLDLDITTPGGSDTASGLGDIIVDPFIISWHRPPFHYVAGVDIYLPTGDYSTKDVANLGRNAWTFEPVLAGTYLNEKNGMEASVKLMYAINTENDDTDYTSGDEFHADFSAAMPIAPGTKLGINGFVYQQTTDDDVPTGGMDSGKGKQFGLGPVLAYNAGKLTVIAKYQKEFETENRPEGDRFWLKAILPF